MSWIPPSRLVGCKYRVLISCRSMFTSSHCRRTKSAPRQRLATMQLHNSDKHSRCGRFQRVFRAQPLWNFPGLTCFGCTRVGERCTRSSHTAWMEVEEKIRCFFWRGKRDLLVGGFNHFLIFSPILGKMYPF